MKRIMKTLIVIMLTIALIGSMGSSAQAKTIKVSGNTVEISTKYNGRSKSYATYATRDAADENPIVFYADKSDFPIRVTICATDYSRSEYEFKSYGIKYVKDVYVPFLGYNTYTYATIDIKPYPQPESKPQKKEDAKAEKVSTQDEIINEKVNQLLDELNLDFIYPEVTPYADHLRAFLDSKWDGDVIRADLNDPDSIYCGYMASCRVYNRNFIWNGINLLTGEHFVKEVNVDYIGYAEVVCPPLPNQQYSFAVSRINKTFEQWCFLDQVDSWTLPKDAGAIDQICLIGENSGDPEECQAIILTLDTEEQSHMYSLYPGGIIEKTY